jgi:hypothetical protein
MWSKLLDLDACSTPTSIRRFCAATDKPKPAWFWVINQETVAVILMPKSSNKSCWCLGPNQETANLGFEAQPRNPSQRFWDPNNQTRAVGFEVQNGKPSTLVLRLNQETCAPHLHVHGADRTRRYSTSRSSNHWDPTCAWSSPVLCTRSSTLS